MLKNIQYATVHLPHINGPIVLLSDTHATSRAAELHPNLLPTIQMLRPELILHAGDICIPTTLKLLEQIAPVLAVRGNRDLTGLSHLPEAIILHLKNHQILLTHGHAPLAHYLVDKIHYIHQGFRFTRYYDYLNSFCPEAQFYFFGHTHITFDHQVNEKRYINPGAACHPNRHDPHPCISLINILNTNLSNKFIYL